MQSPAWNTRAVRTERWKLTWYPLIQRFQLFDIQCDPCELTDLLAPWRVRRRQAEESGKPVWQKDVWAAPDLRSPYTSKEIETAARDLHRRMLEMMDAQGDPLPAEMRPPCPV